MLLIFGLVNAWSNNRMLKKNAKQNQKAFKNELKIEKNKNGELQTSVEVWKGKANDLKEYSKELNEEIEAVKKSKVKVITKIISTYSNDTIEINNKIDSLGKGNYELQWKYSSEDSSRILEGISRFNAKLDTSSLSLKINPGQTIINKDELKLSLVVGVKNNKETGFDEIFVTPKTHGITISGLEGAIIEKPKSNKKNKTAIGFQIGYGIGLNSNNIRLAPYIGIGISKPIINLPF